MPNFFFPDPDHEDPGNIERFCKALPNLKEQGVRVVFLEFLYVDTNRVKGLLESDFTYASGGRNTMRQRYLKIVEVSRELGLEVFGLSRPAYYGLKQKNMRASLAFRLMGPFDGVSAWIIKRWAGAKSYVVFLGSGHWPMLRHFLPGLQPVGQINEVLINPAQMKESVEHLSEMIDLADTFLGSNAYSSEVVKLGAKHSSVIDGIIRQNGVDDLETLKVFFQDKVGVPPDLIQLNYMISKRKLYGAPPQLMPVLRLGQLK